MPTEQVVLSWGTVWAQVLLAVISVIAPLVAAAIVAVLYKIFQYFGIQADSELKKRLQETVINGINFAAIVLAPKLRQGMTAEIKNDVVKIVYNYVKDHGSDTVRGLGVDINDPKLIEAIQARIEKLINDPSISTPPELTPADKKPDATVIGTLKQS